MTDCSTFERLPALIILGQIIIPTTPVCRYTRHTTTVLLTIIINYIRQKKTLHFIFSQVKNINIIIKILLSQKQDSSYCLPLYRDQLQISSLQMLETCVCLDLITKLVVVMSEQSVMTYCRLVVVVQPASVELSV